MTTTCSRGSEVLFFPARNTTPSDLVIETVAAVAERSQTALPGLHVKVDTNALDALFQDGRKGFVEFEYAEHPIKVAADGYVTVRTNEQHHSENS